MRVICLDSGYLMHKGIYSEIARPQMSMKFLYLRMIAGLLRQVKYNYKTDLVILACDGQNNWRKVLSTEYKANRNEIKYKQKPREWWDATYKEFKDEIVRYDSILPFHFITIDKIEADDIAAVCCRFFSKSEIVLITKDADWHQLTKYPYVKVFNPNSKEFEVIENPEAILEEKIMKGCKTDNLLSKVTTPEEYAKRKMIVNLLELPEWVETRIKLELSGIENKEMNFMLNFDKNISQLNFPSVIKQYTKLFGKEYVEPGLEGIEICGETTW